MAEEVRSLCNKPNSLAILGSVAQGRQLPSFTVDGACTALAVADGALIASLAALMRCHPATIWRTCRRYETGDFEKMFSEWARMGLVVKRTTGCVMRYWK